MFYKPVVILSHSNPMKKMSQSPVWLYMIKKETVASVYD